MDKVFENDRNFYLALLIEKFWVGDSWIALRVSRCSFLGIHERKLALENANERWMDPGDTAELWEKSKSR